MSSNQTQAHIRQCKIRKMFVPISLSRQRSSHSVKNETIPNKTSLPFWLGSVGSNTFLIGTITVSAGMRGLSTYLGFLTGPEMGNEVFTITFCNIFPKGLQISRRHNQNTLKAEAHHATTVLDIYYSDYSNLSLTSTCAVCCQGGKQQQQAVFRLTFWNVNSSVEQKQIPSRDAPEAASSICKKRVALT